MPKWAAIATAAALAATGCSEPAQLSVDHAWVRLAALPQNPAAAYFVVHGGPQARTLIAVTSDVSIRSEMHEAMRQGGMVGMKPVERLTVPANGTLAFAPGGRHVMLFGVNRGVKPGKNVTLTCTFADGERISVRADVVGAGDPAPQS